MKITAQVTVSRNSSDEVCIRVVDDASRAEFLDIRMTLESFASVITGLSFVEAAAEVRRLDVVGKKKITEKRSVICPLSTYDKEILKAWLLESCKEDGWEIDAYLGSQNSVGYVKDGTKLNYSVFRYEEV